MKKSDLISLLSKNLENYNEIDINLSADLIQKSIVETLKKRKRVEIRGFGTFCLHTHQSRIARNPKTGEKIALERRNTVHFKPSKELKTRVNNIWSIDFINFTLEYTNG